MINYKTFLILPIFKNNKFSQNDIFNQKNFISRSSETRSLVQALDASIVFEKIINISIPKSSLFINNTVANEIKNNFGDLDSIALYYDTPIEISLRKISFFMRTRVHMIPMTDDTGIMLIELLCSSRDGLNALRETIQLT